MNKVEIVSIRKVLCPLYKKNISMDECCSCEFHKGLGWDDAIDRRQVLCEYKVSSSQAEEEKKLFDIYLDEGIKVEVAGGLVHIETDYFPGNLIALKDGQSVRIRHSSYEKGGNK